MLNAGWRFVGGFRAPLPTSPTRVPLTPLPFMRLGVSIRKWAASRPLVYAAKSR
jgi:hypothetical protein